MRHRSWTEWALLLLAIVALIALLWVSIADAAEIRAEQTADAMRTCKANAGIYATTAGICYDAEPSVLQLRRLTDGLDGEPMSVWWPMRHPMAVCDSAQTRYDELNAMCERAGRGSANQDVSAGTADSRGCVTYSAACSGGLTAYVQCCPDPPSTVHAL